MPNMGVCRVLEVSAVLWSQYLARLRRQDEGVAERRGLSNFREAHAVFRKKIMVSLIM